MASSAFAVTSCQFVLSFLTLSLVKAVDIQLRKDSFQVEADGVLRRIETVSATDEYDYDYSYSYDYTALGADDSYDYTALGADDSYDYSALGAANDDYSDDYYSLGADEGNGAAGSAANGGKDEVPKTPSAPSEEAEPYQVNSFTKMESYGKDGVAKGETEIPVLEQPIIITWNGTTVNLKGSVTGLVAGKTYAFHIHIGQTPIGQPGKADNCKDAETQGKCFTTGVPVGYCPWISPRPNNAHAKADKNGKATWNYKGLNAPPQADALMRPVVFHRVYEDLNAPKFTGPDNNPRMACGLVEAKGSGSKGGGSSKVDKPEPEAKGPSKGAKAR